MSLLLGELMTDTQTRVDACTTNKRVAATAGERG